MTSPYEPPAFEGVKAAKDNPAEPSTDAGVAELAHCLAGTEAAREAAGVATWRPIETAPRDGTRILICLPSSHAIGREVQIARWEKHPLVESCGFVCDTGVPDEGIIRGWMPLPAPPEEGA